MRKSARNMGIDHSSPEKAALQAEVCPPFLSIHSNVVRFFELQRDSKSKRNGRSRVFVCTSQQYSGEHHPSLKVESPTGQEELSHPGHIANPETCWKNTPLKVCMYTLANCFSSYGTPLRVANRLINVVQDRGRWTHVRWICYTLQRDCWSVLCEKDRISMREGT